MSSDLNTAHKEKERVIYNMNQSIEAKVIRLINASRTFYKYSCGCQSKSDVQAVKRVFWEIDEKELITFLGTMVLVRPPLLI